MQTLYLLLALAAIQLVKAQVYLANFTTAPSSFSSTCVQVLNQQVNCNASLLWAGQDGRFETDDTLEYLCTSTCASALSTYVRRVEGACGTSRYEGTDGYDYLAYYNAELVYERYESLCVTNS